MMRNILLFLVLIPLLRAPAFAMDRRLAKPAAVVLKTAAIGTGVGAVAGLAGLVAFDGGVRTVAKGASLGLLGGVVLGLVVLLAPPEFIYGTPPGGDRPQEQEEDEARRRALLPPAVAENFRVIAPVLSLRF